MADLEARGIPTVGVATTEFIEGADRTDDELKKLADDHLEAIMAMLVKAG